LGKYLFRWQWIVVWTGTIFALSQLRSWVPPGFTHLSQLSLHEQLWLVSTMAAAPLALMLVCRALEPFRFKRARADVQNAEILLRQLAATRSASPLAPLVEPDRVPLYKLGSVAKVLSQFVSSFDSADKIKVDLSQNSASPQNWCLQKLVLMSYSPFRTIANNLLLWESEDIVFYTVAAVYFALVYVGSEYFPWAPFTVWLVVLPFLGPKSRAGRHVRALQENIRLAQGKPAEKKGGMEAPVMPEEPDVINWPMMIYIATSHATAFYGLLVLVAFGGVCPLFGNGKVVQLSTLVWSFVLYLMGGLGITAGVHRLWAHRSYKAGAPYRLVLMIFNSIANQGTIWHWARDHRLHHLYSDTAADPHDANRGFWFSHVGWLFWKKSKAVIDAGSTVNMSDLKADPIVMFQKKADPFWNLAWCFALPAFGSMQLGDSLWNGFLIAGVLRYVVQLNATWAVNSVVHAWGNRPYNPSHLTTENGWVSLFAMGEGWHNWHHAFAWDYTAAELGPLTQFNPTTMFIDACAFLGLVYDRKRATKVWEIRKARWVSEQGRPVLESLEGPPLFKSRVVTFGPPLPEDSPPTIDYSEGTSSIEQ
jgi:stearoyl-CoA desaturase (delta-9 desaturase)